MSAELAGPDGRLQALRRALREDPEAGPVRERYHRALRRSYGESALAALLDRERWQAAGEQLREAAVAVLAPRLGAPWRALGFGSGDRALARFHHDRAGLDLVLIPGSARVGLRPFLAALDAPAARTDDERAARGSLDASAFGGALRPLDHREAAACRELGLVEAGGRLLGRSAPVACTPFLRLNVAGRLTGRGGREFQRRLDQLAEEGHRRVVLMLRELETLCSTTLGHLLRWIEGRRAAGGVVLLVDAPAPVRTLLRLLELDELLPLCRASEVPARLSAHGVDPGAEVPERAFAPTGRRARFDDGAGAAH